MIMIFTAWTKRRRRQHCSQTLLRIEHNLLSLNHTKDEDVILWKGKKDTYKPSFTTRDTWNHIRTTKTTVPWHNCLWFSCATPEYQFRTWFDLHDRLSTGERMAVWNATIDGSCVLCQQHLETRSHIFLLLPLLVSSLGQIITKHDMKPLLNELEWHRQSLYHRRSLIGSNSSSPAMSCMQPSTQSREKGMLWSTDMKTWIRLTWGGSVITWGGWVR